MRTRDFYHDMTQQQKLEAAKAYLAETWIGADEYRREDNPAHSYRFGAYWLKPENIEAAREMVMECGK